MLTRKKVFAIVGSASANSANLQVVKHVAAKLSTRADVEIFESLKTLPHFDPGLSIENTPEVILLFRETIAAADAILICTPEYIFSIPGGLKNAIEWCVSTTIFNDKPCGLITASASGDKGHEELKLIMRTLMATFNDDATLLINGVRGKINDRGMITDADTAENLNRFIENFFALMD